MEGSLLDPTLDLFGPDMNGTDHSLLLPKHPPSVSSSYHQSADPSPSGSNGAPGQTIASSHASMPTSAASAPPKKRKKTEDGQPKPEPKKRPQSCDVCRARKVRCIKSDQGGRCEGCVSLDQRCEYTHERKKPGPANSFARRQSPQRQYSNSAPTAYMPHHPSSHVRSYSTSMPGVPNESLDMPPPRWTPPSHMPLDPSAPPLFASAPTANAAAAATLPLPPSAAAAGANFAFDASFLPISPQSLLHPGPGEADSNSEDSPMGRWGWMSGLDDLWDPKPDGMVEGTAVFGNGATSLGSNDLGLTSYPVQANMDQSNRASTDTGAAVDPKPATTTRSVRFDGLAPPTAAQLEALIPRVSRVEDVAPFSTFTRILHAYYAHLYPLMPVVHWPTFSQQLVAREDERSDSWRAFLLSLTAYSIIQLPRSSLSFLPVRELRRLHQRCHAESRRLQNRRYKDPKLIDVATLYCDHIYLGTLGRTNYANIVLAEAIRIAQILNLHDERLQEPTYDVVEQETRRRVFWLLYGSDRTITGLTSVPLHIQDCDLCLPLPLAIDDALLTSAGSFPQPPNIVPVLAGFHFNCRLYRLLGVILTAHRQIIASSAQPIDPFPMLNLAPVPIHIRPSRDFMDELDRIIGDLPGPLQLVNPTSSTPTNPPTGSTSSISNANPNNPDAIAKESGFATCRANIVVSQAMVRFAIRQYAKAIGEEDGASGGREWAEKDVLQLLESMSSESLAANGESLRRKVLFVASSLLEKYPSTAEGHSYVTDFLAVYTRISEEQHAALLEESAAPSREQSPTAAV